MWWQLYALRLAIIGFKNTNFISALRNITPIEIHNRRELQASSIVLLPFDHASPDMANKAKLCCNTVASPLDYSKCITFHLWANPCSFWHQLGFPGKNSAMLQLLRKAVVTLISTTVGYSLMRIRTQAPSIESPAFYHWATALHIFNTCHKIAKEESIVA